MRELGWDIRCTGINAKPSRKAPRGAGSVAPSRARGTGYARIKLAGCQNEQKVAWDCAPLLMGGRTLSVEQQWSSDGWRCLAVGASVFDNVPHLERRRNERPRDWQTRGSSEPRSSSGAATSLGTEPCGGRCGQPPRRPPRGARSVNRRGAGARRRAPAGSLPRFSSNRAPRRHPPAAPRQRSADPLIGSHR